MHQGASTNSVDPRQAAYSAGRGKWRAHFLELQLGGAFRAPDHLIPPVHQELGLGEPLRLDHARAEAG